MKKVNETIELNKKEKTNDNEELNKKEKNNFDSLVYKLIIVIMIGIPLLKFITYVPFISSINPYMITRSRVHFFWGTIFFQLVIYIYGILSKEKKTNYIDYIFYILIFSLFTTTAYSVGFRKSFLGADTRYEGLLTILNYYLLALNTKNLKEKKYKESIIKCFIGLGIIQSLYAILQALTPITFWNRKFSGGAYMAMGLCSNPNFFGAYMAMQLSIITIYYLSKSQWKYLVIYALFTMGLYLAGSSGPLLGYVISFILIAILFRKHYKRIITLLITFILMCYCTDTSIKIIHQDILKNNLDSEYVISNELTDTLEKLNKENVKNIGNGRINLWINSLPLLKEYWLTGCGLDNFGDVYPQSGNVYYDKAHNVYLQMGITNGIIPLILYMFICLIAFLKGFKLKKTYAISVFMCFTTYCILAFANISTIDVAPYFYIMFGLLLSEIKEIKILRKK